MTIVYGVIVTFFIIIGFISIVGFLTKEKPKKDPFIIPKDDTWEKRYLSLAREIWYMSDEELDDFSYDEDHEDVLDELKAMNKAIHAERMKDDTL